MMIDEVRLDRYPDFASAAFFAASAVSVVSSSLRSA